MTGPELRAARKRLNLTQAEFGALIGRNRVQVVRYEAGEAEIPPPIPLLVRMLLEHGVPAE